MNCVNNVTFPFSSIITIPEGFLYNNENQLSVAISTDNLNIYAAEESFITNDIENPCTGEPITDAQVYVKEIRLTGTIIYRMALNALISSYNFMIGSELANVNDEGWSSTDGFAPIEVVDDGVVKDYIVIGYVNPQDPDNIPTEEDISVVLENYDVVEYTIGNQIVLELTGEFSFIVNN